MLHLAVHFIFICSLRIGELLAATWDCIDFEKKEFHVNKILQRVNKSSIELLNKDGVFMASIVPVKVSEQEIMSCFEKAEDKIKQPFNFPDR